ncbi:MAG: beta-glucosidase [Armatimonadetes bacterium]|nr:beta-glucosidase [Armatimonadota bacterium]
MRIFALCLALVLQAWPAVARPLYLDAKSPVEARVQDLLSRMTLEEKIGQMTQLNYSAINSTGKEDAVDVDEKKLRAVIRNFHVGSFLNGFAVPPAQWADYYATLQRINLEESRLKIPIVYGIDHVHGTNYITGGTVFPQNLNMAATFNDSLAAAEGRITALESADLGHAWDFAPILDVGINPYWSRLYETFGEEPLVGARMGAAFIRALQDAPEIAPYRVAGTAKHFIGYSNPSSGHDRTPAQIPDQFLQEFWVPAFRAAIEAGVKTVMINSGEVNGVPVHTSRRLLVELLRDQLGFTGVAVTDWEDILKLVNHHRVAADEREATRLAVDAGIDMAMTPFTTDFCVHLKSLVREGAISPARIDESVARILRLKFDLGLFEHPYPRTNRFPRIGAADHRMAALQAARESIVLLENRGALPLSDQAQAILVIGPAAESKRNVNGGWTLGWMGRPEPEYPHSMPTVREALKRAFPHASVRSASNPSADEMRAADVIVAAMGEEPYAEGPGNIDDLSLPWQQHALLRAAADSGRPVVLVLFEGRPRIVSGISDRMAAVVFAGLPGFEGPTAVAEVLSGKVNPSGRLPFSYPRTVGHVVPFHHKPSDKSGAQYPFGSGLSYTKFEYSGLSLSAERLRPSAEITATVTVKNAGRVAGQESVLWYLTDEVGRVTRPVRRLGHYEKITLQPGQSTQVKFRIVPREALAYPDERGRKVLEPGAFTLRVGNQAARFFLDGE